MVTLNVYEYVSVWVDCIKVISRIIYEFWGGFMSVRVSQGVL